MNPVKTSADPAFVARRDDLLFQSAQSDGKGGFVPVTVRDTSPRPDINAYFRKFYPEDWEDPRAYEASPSQLIGCTRNYIGKGDRCFRFPRIECADGFSMSVQGYSEAYCRPRGDFEDHYTMVEIGFPSEREELIMPYIDGGEDTDPTQTVYGYVPVELVEQIIAKHGGFAQSASPDHRDALIAELCEALDALNHIISKVTHTSGGRRYNSYQDFVDLNEKGLGEALEQASAALRRARGLA